MYQKQVKAAYLQLLKERVARLVSLGKYNEWRGHKLSFKKWYQLVESVHNHFDAKPEINIAP